MRITQRRKSASSMSPVTMGRSGRRGSKFSREAITCGVMSAGVGISTENLMCMLPFCMGLWWNGMPSFTRERKSPSLITSPVERTTICRPSKCVITNSKPQSACVFVHVSKNTNKNKKQNDVGNVSLVHLHEFDRLEHGQIILLAFKHVMRFHFQSNNHITRFETRLADLLGNV